MALASITDVQKVPMLNGQPTEYLNMVLTMAIAAVKAYCKRDLDAATYTEYYSGAGQADLVLRQSPVTAITSVNLDPAGNFGIPALAFPSTTLLTAGTQYALVRDEGTKSRRGLLRRISGGDGGFFGYFPESYQVGKLAARRLPSWPRGDGNIKVVYTAGYADGSVPADLTAAVVMLTAWFARNMPTGGPLTSESLGAYSYSVGSGQIGSAPELGTLKSLLSRYREVSI